MTITHPYWFVAALIANLAIFLGLTVLAERRRSARMTHSMLRELHGQVRVAVALRRVLADEVAYVYRLEAIILLLNPRDPVLDTRPPVAELLELVNDRDWANLDRVRHGQKIEKAPNERS